MTTVTDYTALISGDSWNGLEITNSPAIVTFSFATTAPAADLDTMGAAAYATFQTLTASQQTMVISALNEWGSASGITFVQVAAGKSDITFSSYDFSSSYYSGVAGVGFYPFGDWNYYSYPNFLDGWAGAGNVLLNTDYETNGDFNYGLILHEIGHALGLKHPTETFYNGASGTNHDQVLASDTGTDTIMTQQASSLQHLTTLDVAAIQSMYGTNAQDGSQVASWAYNSGTNSFTFTALAAGGFTRGSAVNDTINGSNNVDKIVGLYGDDSLFGNGGNDTLFGGSGNDVLNGGTGDDTMYGGFGNDTYYVDSPFDYVVEFDNEGIDTVVSGMTYTLGSNVENLVLKGSNAINGTGNELNNYIEGNDGDNVLEGGAGNDGLHGGLGNDTASYASAGSAVNVNLEGNGVWQDTLGAGQDFLSSIENLIGSAFADTLIGDSNANRLTGGDGDDTFYGNAGVDTIYGGKGNDILNGGTGADVMFGGADNDTYYVDNSADAVTELANEGTDTVVSSVNYSLTANIENLILSGTADLVGVGNGQDNYIQGNAGNNVLQGGGGNDGLYGGAGWDTVVYSEASVGVTVNLELQNQWQNTVGAGNDYLSSIENLNGSNFNDTLIGDASVNVLQGLDGADTFYGNAGNDTIFGGKGNDILNGGTGADTMVGGADNDTYYVDDNGDVVTEALNEGTDTVVSSISYTLAANVENLVLSGSAGLSGTGNGLDNYIAGNSGANALSGGIGNDVLVGGAGNDTLTGGTGVDVFIFAAAGAANGVDEVIDFTSGTDKLGFTAGDYGFTAGHALAANEFTLGGSASGTHSQFIFDAATHSLLWDQDGTGVAAAIKIATLDNVNTLATSDFTFL